MPLDEQQTWALLRDLDEPGQWDFPHDYNGPAARARFIRLAVRLEQRFGCVCEVDRELRPARCHGRIIVPAAATGTPEDVVLTLSNFGNLAVVTLGSPGSYDEDEERELFPAADRRRIEEELALLGYVSVSEHPLWTKYNGISGFEALYPPERPPSWWHRFFDDW